MEEILGSIAFLILYGLCIQYCYKVAKKIGTNETIAIVFAILIPFGSALIYNHLSYRSKGGTSPREGIFK